jgi:hypothetical protein
MLERAMVVRYTYAHQIGVIAQLVERFDGIEEVVGSIPSGSTEFVMPQHNTIQI